MDAIKQPFSIGENEINITASIGISQFSLDAPDADALMKNANIALNFSKEQGRNNFQFYNPSLNEKHHKRMQIEKHLRKAIERNEFQLHYQPQVDIHTSQVTGVESLLRWNSPELGFVSPVDFIPVAEETGLILEIGQWVIKEACRNNKAWQHAGLPNMVVTVNLSSRQFYDEKLEEMIRCTLNDTGLAPEFLELEITESITMDVKVALSTLKGLKNMGLKIAMDDFGTGYSSLSYLKEFPIDTLKIDQSFIKDIDTVSVNAAIVNTIITLAGNLKLKVIAEGVETKEALKLLKEYGCDMAQGYLYSPPMVAEQIEEIIRFFKNG
jgi:EAL domain-containing protein (putative c-di-GMP-specific phosphodiesterase class I)